MPGATPDSPAAPDDSPMPSGEGAEAVAPRPVADHVPSVGCEGSGGPVAIRVDIKRTFQVNGKVYASLEDVPAELRAAIAQATALGTGAAAARSAEHRRQRSHGLQRGRSAPGSAGAPGAGAGRGDDRCVAAPAEPRARCEPCSGSVRWNVPRAGPVAPPDRHPFRLARSPRLPRVHLSLSARSAGKSKSHRHAGEGTTVTEERVRRGLHQRRHRVVDLDLSRFFDCIRQDRLLRRLARRVQDDKILALVKQFLKSTGKRGMPQGSPMTPPTQRAISSLRPLCPTREGSGRTVEG